MEEIQPADLDDVDIAIRDYIITNHGKNINEVADYMYKKSGPSCSKLTTRKKIIGRGGLVEKGEIEDRRVGKRFHKLYPCDKSLFNWLYREVSEIQKIVDLMFESNRTLSSQLGPQYTDTISTILKFLLTKTVDRTEKKQLSSYDSQIIYSIIGRLLIKVNCTWDYNYNHLAKILRTKRVMLTKIRDALPNFSWAKEDPMNFKLVDDLTQKCEEFENHINSVLERYSNEKKS